MWDKFHTHLHVLVLDTTPKLGYEATKVKEIDTGFLLAQPIFPHA